MKKIIISALVCFFALTSFAMAQGPGNCPWWNNGNGGNGGNGYGMGQGMGRGMVGMMGNRGMMLPPGKWWQLPNAVKSLNLSAEEQAKLNDLFLKNRTELIDLKSNLQKERLALDQIMDNPKFDEAAAKYQQNKLDDARAKLSKSRFDFLLGVRKILGNDRYQKLKTECYQWGYHNRGMRGRGMKGRGMREPGMMMQSPPPMQQQQMMPEQQGTDN